MGRFIFEGNVKFELKPDNRNSSEQDLIDDLIAVAKKLGKVKTITRNEYDKYGRHFFINKH